MDNENNKQLIKFKESSLIKVSNLIALTNKLLKRSDFFNSFILKRKLHESHSKGASSFIYSPINNYILTCGDDWNAKLWDINGVLIHSFIDENSKVSAINFSSDEKLVVTGSEIGSVNIWHISGKLLYSFYVKDEYIYEVLFCSNDSYIVTISKSLKVNHENYEQTNVNFIDFTGKIINTLCFSRANLSVLPKLNLILVCNQFSTEIFDFNGKRINNIEGKYISVSSVNNLILTTHYTKVFLWNTNGSLLSNIDCFGRHIRESCVSPDGNFFIISFEYNNIELYSFKGNLILKFKEHSNKPTSLSFSNDSKYILSTSVSEMLIWDLTGQVVHFYNVGFNVCKTGFSKDDSQIFVLSNNLFVYNKNFIFVDYSWIGKTKNDYFIHSKVFCKPLIGNLLTAKSYYTISDSFITIYNIEGETVLEYLFPFDITFACFSKSGKYLITNREMPNQFALWHLEDSLVNTIEKIDADIPITFNNIEHNIWLSFGGIRKFVYQLSDHHLILKSKDSKHPIASAIFSPDENNILTSYLGESYATRWGIDGNIIQEYETLYDGSSSIEFSPDGNYVLVGGTYFNINGEEKFCFYHDGDIGDADDDYSTKGCFSPDGKLILSGGEDKLCKLWDLEGNCLLTLTGHKSAIKSICFSPDGKNIFTSSTDGVIIIWDTKGNILQTLNDHNENSLLIKCSSDNKYLISIGGSITLWERK